MYQKTYDSQYLIKLNELFSYTKKRGVALLNPSSYDVIADIGCGNGCDAFEISGFGSAMYGIDHDPELIAIAKQKYCQENITFICCEANNIPLASNTLNKIRFDRVFQHIEDHDEIISEAQRLLTENGQIQIIDTDYFSMSLFLESQILERKIIDAMAYRRFKGAPLIRKLKHKLERCGFNIDNVEVHNYVFTDRNLIENLLRFDKVVREEFEMGLINKEEFKDWEEVESLELMLSLNLLMIMATKK